MFTERLKKAREKNGLKQDELAEKIFVSRTSITRWECGKHQPCVDDLNALCDALGVSADWLLGRVD